MRVWGDYLKLIAACFIMDYAIFWPRKTHSKEITAIARAFSASVNGVLGVDDAAHTYGASIGGRFVCIRCQLGDCDKCMDWILDLNNDTVRCGCRHV